MSNHFGIIGSVYQALLSEIKMPVFHYVPQGAVLPYAVLELKEIGLGNGLPAPHFRTRGALAVRVWSAYEGVTPLSESLAQLEAFFEARAMVLDGGVAHFSIQKTTIDGQQASAKKPLRTGEILLHFFITTERRHHA